MPSSATVMPELIRPGDESSGILARHRVADEKAHPAASTASDQSPESRLLRTLRRLDIGRLADAAMAGAVIALLLTMILGKVKLDVIGGLFSLCVVLVLLALASYDLFIRWSEVDLDAPDRP